MKKQDMACTTIRKTPLHVPDTGPHIRQGLSAMIDAPTIAEGVACSPLSGTTCLSHGLPCPTRSFGAVGNLSLDNTGGCRCALTRYAVHSSRPPSVS